MSKSKKTNRTPSRSSMTSKKSKMSGKASDSDKAGSTSDSNKSGKDGDDLRQVPQGSTLKGSTSTIDSKVSLGNKGSEDEKNEKDKKNSKRNTSESSGGSKMSLNDRKSKKGKEEKGVNDAKRRSSQYSIGSKKSLRDDKSSVRGSKRSSIKLSGVSEDLEDMKAKEDMPPVPNLEPCDASQADTSNDSNVPRCDPEACTAMRALAQKYAESVKFAPGTDGSQVLGQEMGQSQQGDDGTEMQNQGSQGYQGSRGSQGSWRQGSRGSGYEHESQDKQMQGSQAQQGQESLEQQSNCSARTSFQVQQGQGQPYQQGQGQSYQQGQGQSFQQGQGQPYQQGQCQPYQQGPGFPGTQGQGPCGQQSFGPLCQGPYGPQLCQGVPGFLPLSQAPTMTSFQLPVQRYDEVDSDIPPDFYYGFYRPQPCSGQLCTEHRPTIPIWEEPEFPIMQHPRSSCGPPRRFVVPFTYELLPLQQSPAQAQDGQGRQSEGQCPNQCPPHLPQGQLPPPQGQPPPPQGQPPPPQGQPPPPQGQPPPPQGQYPPEQRQPPPGGQNQQTKGPFSSGERKPSLQESRKKSQETQGRYSSRQTQPPFQQSHHLRGQSLCQNQFPQESSRLCPQLDAPSMGQYPPQGQNLSRQGNGQLQVECLFHQGHYFPSEAQSTSQHIQYPHVQNPVYSYQGQYQMGQTQLIPEQLKCPAQQNQFHSNQGQYISSQNYPMPPQGQYQPGQYQIQQSERQYPLGQSQQGQYFQGHSQTIPQQIQFQINQDQCPQERMLPYHGQKLGPNQGHIPSKSKLTQSFESNDPSFSRLQVVPNAQQQVPLKKGEISNINSCPGANGICPSVKSLIVLKERPITCSNKQDGYLGEKNELLRPRSKMCLQRTQNALTQMRSQNDVLLMRCPTKPQMSETEVEPNITMHLNKPFEPPQMAQAAVCAYTTFAPETLDSTVPESDSGALVSGPQQVAIQPGNLPCIPTGNNPSQPCGRGAEMGTCPLGSWLGGTCMPDEVTREEPVSSPQPPQITSEQEGPDATPPQPPEAPKGRNETQFADPSIDKKPDVPVYTYRDPQCNMLCRGSSRFCSEAVPLGAIMSLQLATTYVTGYPSRRGPSCPMAPYYSTYWRHERMNILPEAKANAWTECLEHPWFHRCFHSEPCTLMENDVEPSGWPNPCTCSMNIASHRDAAPQMKSEGTNVVPRDLEAVASINSRASAIVPHSTSRRSSEPPN